MSMQETVLEKSSGAVWVSCCHHTKQYLMTKITWCVSHQRDNFLRWSSWLQPRCIGVISWLSNVLGTCWIYQWRALLSVICCWVCFGFVNHINNQIARYPWLQPHMFQLLLEMGWDEVPIDQKRHSIKYSPWHERFQMMSSSINAFSGFFQLWFHPPLCKRNTWAAMLILSCNPPLNIEARSLWFERQQQWAMRIYSYDAPIYHKQQMRMW
jgi:hypothetical protein